MTNNVSSYHFLLKFADVKMLQMITDDERISLIQKVIATGQSDNSWNAVLELFAAWPNNINKTAAFKMAESLMQNWKDEERIINSSWKLLYEKNELSSIALLARSLHVNRREANGRKELMAIVTSLNAYNIKQLQIDRSDIGADGMYELARSNKLQNLTSLSFNGISFIQNTFETIINPSELKALKKLSLKNCAVYGNKLQMLMSSGIILPLQILELPHNTMADKDAFEIASSTAVTNIELLDLSNNFINDAGAIALSTSSNLKNLKTLILTGNKIIKASSILDNVEKNKQLKIII